mmetsp:Transcript_14613/g.35271  ORF Transcript_14613/g.35271 Transcript_14613/m.35271 type:complete len:267 (-) Transcript_14613:99-899(-)
MLGGWYSTAPPQRETYETFFGLRGVEMDGGSCERGGTGDDRFEAAFAFAVLNCLLTSIGLIVLLLIQFQVFQATNLVDSVWNALRWTLYTSLWCCLFTFYVQESAACQVAEDAAFAGSAGISGLSADDLMALSQLSSGYDWQVETSCSLGGAGIVQVFNVLLLIGICILMMLTPQPSSMVHSINDDATGNRGGQQAQNTASNVLPPVATKPTTATMVGAKDLEREEYEEEEEGDEWSEEESSEDESYYESDSEDEQKNAKKNAKKK